MGLSSSQARLLHLTSRMHQIEYKAAKTQAEKLQMANESARVYDEYLDALEETRIQYGRLTSDGSVEFRNASANILQNGVVPGYEGEHAASPLFLQAQNGEIWVTPRVATEFGIEGRAATLPMNEYIHEQTGLDMTEGHIWSWRDTDQIASFTPVANGSLQQYVHNEGHHWTVNGTIADSTYSSSSVNQPIDFTPNTTYTISSSEELARFLTIVDDRQLTNVRLELTGDIDMTGVNYTPPSDVSGIIFDGNGNRITGLTSPLFNSISNSTIQNLEIYGPSTISGTGSQGCIANTVLAGGTTTIQNISIPLPDGYEESIHVNSSNGIAGGLVGCNNGNLNINECFLEKVMVNGNTSGGGFVGTNNGDLGIDNSIIVGGVESNGTKGKCVGANNGSLSITNSDFHGGNDGTVYANKPVGNESSTNYTSNYPDSPSGYGLTTDTTPTNSSTPSITIIGSDNYVTTYTATIPSIDINSEGGYYSNIISLLTVHNNQEPDAGLILQVKNYLKDVNPDTLEGNRGLYYLNNHIVDYLQSVNNGTQSVQFAAALLNDITHGTTSYTAAGGYRNGTDPIDVIERTGSSSACTTTYHDDTVHENGSLEIPALADIKAAVQTALQKAGYSVTTEQINSYFSPAQYNTSNGEDLASLAYINQLVNQYAASGNSGVISTLASNITSSPQIRTTGSPTGMDSSHINYYDIGMDTTPRGVQINYVQEYYDTGVPDGTQYWDLSVPAIAQAMAMWVLAQRGCQILDPEQAESEEYLTNSINAGEYVLTTFNPSNVELLEGLTQQQIDEMTDSQYNELMGIVNTSVAVETNLQEVQDETLLRIAEAKYEADMRKIDKKERKYDAELATYDNERNAIKQEIETLKTVARENVDRTFKLFS